MKEHLIVCLILPIKKIDRQNAKTKEKRHQAMTISETVEIVKESSIWNFLSIGEKIDALVYAVEGTDVILINRDGQLDISDIIGEIFVDVE